MAVEEWVVHDGRDDPIDELRRAWSRVRPPPLAGRLGAGRLGEEDPATRQAVRWMREAWRRLEAPAARVPRRNRAAGRRPGVKLAAAAIVPLALGGWLVGGWLSDGWPSGGWPSGERAEAEATRTSIPRVIRTTADRIELVSGNVRLILLQPQPETPQLETKETR